MNKFKLSHFPHLKEGDEVLYMNQYSNNITTCNDSQCTICIVEMVNGYAGFIRDGIYHYETTR